MKFIRVLLFSAAAIAAPAPQQSQSNGTCNAVAAAKLLGGIQANMALQAQELQYLKALQTVLPSATTPTSSTKSTTNGTTNFQLEQQALLTIQKTAIDQRTFNQKIAGDLNSPSQRGLAIVAQSQNMAIIQVKGLQGGGDADKTMLETLVKEVESSMKQNMMNLQMAESQCKRK